MAECRSLKRKQEQHEFLPVQPRGSVLVKTDLLAETLPEVFSSSAVTTRAQAKRDVQENNSFNDSIFLNILGSDLVPESVDGVKMTSRPPACFDFVTDKLISRGALVDVQKNDPTLEKCVSAEKSSFSPRNQQFYWKDAVLMRKWSSTLSAAQADEWDVVHQIVVPLQFRQPVLSLAHDHPWSGHLGINKTYNRVLQHFFWPGLKSDVARYCKTCHICQVRGKPNQVVPPAPLCPIPIVGEPFEHVLVDHSLV